MTQARVKGYNKDSLTGDIILVAYPIDEQGKPIETGKNIEIKLSQDALQKLISEQTETEETRIQNLLDRIHKDRLERILNVEKIDDRIEQLQKTVVGDFDKCTTKLDVTKVQHTYRVQMALLTQKRHLSRFSIQEESDLSLQLAKIRAKANSDR